MSTSNKISQLELFEEALKGLTSKEDDEVDIIFRSQYLLYRSLWVLNLKHLRPTQVSGKLKTRQDPSGKPYILIPKRFLISRASTQFVSANYSQCDEIPNSIDYNMAQSEEAHQQGYDIRAACERQWLGKTFRLPRNRCNRRRSAHQINGTTKKTRYKLEWRNI